LQYPIGYYHRRCDLPSVRIWDISRPMIGKPDKPAMSGSERQRRHRERHAKRSTDLSQATLASIKTLQRETGLTTDATIALAIEVYISHQTADKPTAQPLQSTDLPQRDNQSPEAPPAAPWPHRAPANVLGQSQTNLAKASKRPRRQRAPDASEERQLALSWLEAPR
jgi:hypothetical protein